MIVTTVALVIFSIIFLGWSIVKLNTNCMEKYAYEPFNLNVAFLLLIPIACALFFWDVRYGTRTSELTPDLLQNMYAAVGIGIAVLSFVFIRISYKTAIPIAIYAVILQCIISVVFIVISMIFFMILSNESNKFDK